MEPPYHGMRTFVLNTPTMGQPEGFIQYTPQRFNPDGSVQDESTRQFLQGWMAPHAK